MNGAAAYIGLMVLASHLQPQHISASGTIEPSISRMLLRTSLLPVNPPISSMDYHLIAMEPGPSQPLSTAPGYGRSNIPLDHMKISAAQLKAIQSIYRADATATPPDKFSLADFLYGVRDNDQLVASAVMAQQGLDIDSREQLDNHWSIQWSCSSGKFPKAVNQTRRMLLLCRCGYDHGRYDTTECHTPVPFTSCLAHAEITYAVDSHKILQICGYFNHNQACKDAEFTRFPAIPVHPSVFVVTLSQLRDGASFADFSRMNGVKVTEKPQVNVDEWLDLESPQYNTTIADAVFHFSAGAAKGDCFEACVATEEMNAAAWKYGQETLQATYIVTPMG
ncbi:hypothetical protein DFH07DRAFT_783183 [Mycena maculata]|uniref:Uncharacterized protein n=1 Tax=Mycena maculata TaxID=230809 RepID=A0AAD7HNT4_9AGAR|nr:hypothetical protein DFH07DRAFT_783183 [Mycena maculata]